MAWMTRQDITIGGYQLMELSQFQIQAEVNQHGKLYLEGMLSDLYRPAGADRNTYI